MNLKLTHRQEEFIRNLHQLSREADGPIHYTVLAERLGVSPFTAYDMLCLLEEKGLAVSEYQLDTQKSGPGRAERVFYPSTQARYVQQQFASVIGCDNYEFENSGMVILEGMYRDHPSTRELAEEMLARIPPDTSPGELRYCLEVLTIIALRLRQIDPIPDVSAQLGDFLPADKKFHESEICFLLGYLFGILSRNRSVDPDWLSKLQSHVSKCLEIVSLISPEQVSLLGNYAVQLFLHPTALNELLIVRDTVEEHP